MSLLTNHTAAGQALGYFFQLDRTLCNIADSPGGSIIGIETEDDVVVKLINGEKIHEQDKSSTTTFPFLPSKPDLWKSLLIWAEAIKSEEINPEQTKFILVSNKSQSKCLAQKISDAANDAEVLSCLNELKTFNKKSNEVTKNYIEKLFSIDDETLMKLISKTTLISGDAMNAEAIKSHLISSFQIVDGDDEEKLSILNEIYGWLFNLVRTAWQDNEPAWIERDAVVRLKNTILTRRVQSFLNEKIFQVRDISEQEIAINKLKMYVKQLIIIGSSDEEIMEAISDYLNSVEKRTQLAKKGYVTELQIEGMVENLRKRWITIAKKIPIQNKSLSKEDQGKLICLDTMDHNAKIGNMETNNYFLTRGTYHHLSDSLQVGWHPEFQSVLHK
jgi:hypothetical protein